jgi:hypothetical protein
LGAVAAEQGQPIDSIMRRFALPPHMRMGLEAYAVENGPVGNYASTQWMRVQDLGSQYGISDPLASGLERTALRGPIGAAVRGDLHARIEIGQISHRYGITPAAIQAAKGTPLNEISLNPSLSSEHRARAIAQLAQILLDGPAGESLRAGASPSVIAHNYGIDPGVVETYAQRMQYRQP